jgi:vacuolar protein sorting-associated protein IST1
MREVAVMLSEDPPKEEKARIRAEALIRDDNLIEAYEILQLECELLHERIKLIEYSKECPSDLVSVVSTIMWASQRVDIPELLMVRKQFRAKYGKQFDEDAINNVGGILNERVVSKLSIHPPAAYLVQTYLEKICEQFEVDWTPRVKLSTDQMIEPMAAPVGYSVQVAQGTGLGTSVMAVPLSSAVVTGNSDRPLQDCDIPLAPSGMSRGGRGGPGYNGDGGGAIPAGGSVPTPIVTAQAYVPQVEKKDDDFDEVDIFVPGAGGDNGGGVTGFGPSAPPSSTLTSPSSTASSAADRGGGGSTVAVSSGGQSANPSYEDLAARFNQLKK